MFAPTLRNFLTDRNSPAKAGLHLFIKIIGSRILNCADDRYHIQYLSISVLRRGLSKFIETAYLIVAQEEE